MQPKQMRRTALMSWVMVLITACWTSIALAAFESGSTGADGAFEPTASIAVQIPESGVFNYTTVNIPSGVTVTYKKNSKNTPVTVLASGDVTINGSINLNGSSANYLIPGDGGPGGFDGGQGGASYGIGKRGEGPGGGTGGGAYTGTEYGSAGGSGGGFSSVGSAGGASPYGWVAASTGGVSYSSERILPAIGGSGGGGGGGTSKFVGGGGGGGGGAIVIASTGTITVNGTISANGGTGATPSSGQSYYSGGGGGSGGSIRLIANTIAGNGTITSNGGGGGDSASCGRGGTGAVGRIRFEAGSILRTSATSPALTAGYPYAVVPQDMPSLTISSIGGLSVPSVPQGAYRSPDVMLPFNTRNPVTVVVTGTNIPVGQTVTVKASPSVGAVSTASATLDGSEASSSASVSLTIATAYPSLITASVTFQLSAANGAPLYAQGERVEKVRVSADLGGKSLLTYITTSGKEIQVL